MISNLPKDKNGKIMAGKGRLPGSINKIKPLKVEEILLELGIDPVQKLVELLPMLKPIEQCQMLMGLLKYCYALPAASIDLKEPQINITYTKANS